MSNIQLQIATTKVFLRKLSDDNLTISQILDIKIHKNGVFQLNKIGSINYMSTNMCMNSYWYPNYD